MPINCSKSVLISLIAVVVTANGLAGATLKPAVGPKMLLEGGDCLGDEVLAWQRLRAERRIVLRQDDSTPVACSDATGRVYLVNGSGKLLTSDNAGQSFSPPTQIVVAGHPVTDVQAMGVLKSTAGFPLWLGQPRGPLVIAYEENGKLCVARSEDDGKSWQAVTEIRPLGYGRTQAGGVRMIQLADGAVLLAVAAWKGNGREDPDGLVYVSRNEGKTWMELGSLGPRCAGANLLQLKSGELLAAITYQGPRQDGDPSTEIKREEVFDNVVVARSRDGGRTWLEYQCVTRFKEAPGELSELSDGTVVLTYGQQNFPYGARAVLSMDGGKTWDSRVYILGFSTVWAEWYDGYMKETEPGWRVTSVVLKDDTILSLYTCGSLVLTQEMLVYPIVTQWYTKNGIPGEKGKVIMSVRWTPDGMKKPPLGVPAGITLLAKPNSEGYLDNGRSLIRPELLNEGGDYFHQDEILAYQRISGEHHVVGPGSAAVVCLDPTGRPVVSVQQGRIYRSEDQGRTWEQIGGTPEGRSIDSFGILRDGTILASSGGGQAEEVFRSGDGGKTWSAPSLIVPHSFDSMGIGQCVRMNQMPDGTVLVTCGHSLRQKGDWNGVYRSRDGGKTWGDFNYLSRPGCETNLLRLKSGKLLAAIRYQQDPPMSDDFVELDVYNTYRVDFLKNVALAVSEDGGYTWSSPWTVGRFNEAPGDLVETEDGAVVLTYQQKNAPSGARAMVSRDQGKIWDSMVYMLGWWGRSGGHTSSVVLRDGRVLTVDCGFSPAVNSYLVEATIWRPIRGR